MLFKLFILLTLSFELFSTEVLKNNYYVPTNEIMLSSVLPQTKKDLKLFNITQGRFTKRVKTSELITLLKSHGYDGFSSKSRYIKFTKESKIDKSKIRSFLVKLYKKKYKNIKIKEIIIHPRGYIKEIPKNFEIKIQSKSHLNKKGTLSIKSKENRQIFFNYYINAEVYVYKARKNIKRDEELSNLNSVKKSIILNKFRAMPVQQISKGLFQSKHHIKINSVLTQRDVQALNLVKRGEMVSVTLNKKNISISFSAKALRSGVYGDIIKVKNKNSKVIRVKITGKNRGEVI